MTFLRELTFLIETTTAKHPDENQDPVLYSQYHIERSCHSQNGHLAILGESTLSPDNLDRSEISNEIQAMTTTLYFIAPLFSG